MKRLLLVVTLVTMFLLMPIQVEAKTKTEFELAQEVYYSLFDELDNTEDEDLEEWFHKYQILADKYDKDRDTLDCIFSDEEIQLMWQVIETEAYDATFIQKINVANVLLNRFQSLDFNYMDMIEVITEKNQFTYHRTKITQSTKDALTFAFEVRDTTDGCISFRSDKKVDNWHGWEYAMYDGAHWFYKVKEEKNKNE